MDHDGDSTADAVSIRTMLSSSTVSSTATAPNLPGPGRNLGLLFDKLGGGFERFVNRRAEKLTSAADIDRDRTSNLQLVRVQSSKSFDTDATAPNLPGAGRTVGNLLSMLGKGLERLITRRAAQIGLGPGVVAQDIRALYSHIISPAQTGRLTSPLGSEYFNWRPSDKEAKIVTKMINRLLKYSKARLLSTQLEALNEITKISIENNFLRELLGSQQLSKYLNPEYSEPELHWASAKAFLSIKENEVHSVWSQFYHYTYVSGDPVPPTEQNIFHSLQEKIKGYLWDPNLSFIMARHIQTRLDYFVSPDISANPALDLWRYHLDVAASHPEIVEWELFDDYFASNPRAVVWASKSIFRIAYHMPKFRVEYSSRKAFERLLKTDYCLDTEASDDATYKNQFHYHFLAELCDSEDLAVQLATCEDIVYGNELFIAYIHVVYHAAKSLREISKALGFPSLVEAKSEYPECAVFLHYLGCGNPEERTLAEAMISNAVRTIRYCKSSMNALVELRNDVYGEASPSHWLFNQVSWLGDGTVLNRSQFPELNDHYDITLMKPEDVLHYPSNAIIWIEVFGDVEPLDITGHYPILAGYTAGENPKELYVAMVFERWNPLSTYYTYVEDGARAVEYVDDGGKKRAATSFFLAALRYDVLDIANALFSGIVVARRLLQTGPVFWSRGATTKPGGPRSWMELLGRPVTFLDDQPNETPDNKITDWSDTRKSFSERVEEIREVLVAGQIVEVGVSEIL